MEALMASLCASAGAAWDLVACRFQPSAAILFADRTT